MHFDDRLATVLRLAATSPAMARIQYRQLIDLLGREAQEATAPDTLRAAMARLDELNAIIPASARAAMLRESSMRLANADLVANLTLAEPEVAIAAIAAADLPEATWLALIPALPVRARGILRHRRGYGPAVDALLERLGIADRGLPPAALTPERVQRPELVVLEGGAATKPRRSLREEPSTAGIGSIVRRIEAFRKAQTPPAETLDGAAARVEPAIDRARTAVLAFDFTTDAEGRVDWADGPLAAGFVGSMLAALGDTQDPALQAAVRHRQPMRNQAVLLRGAPALTGSWTLDALPRFGGHHGAFLGFAGRLRRPARPAQAQEAALSSMAGGMREVLHELRTPANAIQVAAEIIQQQLYGPAPHEYRALAAAIAGDTAQILAGFEELDRLVRLEGGAMKTQPGECDLASLVFETVARLRTWTTPRGSGFALPDLMPDAMVAVNREEAARLIWRLLASLAGVSSTGETIALAFARHMGEVCLTIEVPASLAQRLDDAATTAQPVELVRSLSAGMFGIGFTLRLAEAEAAAAGGGLSRDQGSFRLILPGLTPEASGHTQA
jgi:signal transduction histidine kinase